MNPQALSSCILAGGVANSVRMSGGLAE